MSVADYASSLCLQLCHLHAPEVGARVAHMSIMDHVHSLCVCNESTHTLCAGCLLWPWCALEV
eukprot:15476097-Alexandrium_andersonii.AAC.1